jgi:hypothetical protein
MFGILHHNVGIIAGCEEQYRMHHTVQKQMPGHLTKNIHVSGECTLSEGM